MTENSTKNSLLTSRINFFASAKAMTFTGIILGLALIILSLAIDLYFSDESFTISSIKGRYEDNVTHWIILSSPFFLGGFFYFMGRIIHQREAVIEHQLHNEKDQFKILEHFISELEKESFTAAVSESFKNKNVANQLEKFREKLATGKKDEEQRLWESKGLASFGEILRTENDLETLSTEVLRYLVKYLGCNQGSIFILNNDEHLELKSCYAYDKKKFLSKIVNIGEGLVGQCFLEKETMLLYDVPKDYIKITSGLGLATPSCVVIVPLKHNEHIAGVLEIASFNQLQQQEISFLEKCAEAFASVLQTTMANSNIKVLLEQSQQQMEELRSQEEEMRQNMEELQAIQEQMSRQLNENTSIRAQLEAREKVLSQTTILSESDLYGTITFVNEKFEEVSQFQSEELVGKGHNIVRHPDMPKELFKEMWRTVKSGRSFRGIIKNKKKDGSHYWVDATIVPIFEDGKIVKYIGARYHITDERMAEKLFQRQLAAMGIESEILMLQ